MTAPTKDQLDRYMDLMLEGQDAEDAIAVIWADEPEPAPKTKPVNVMVTEFPDGVVIGWDHCAIGNSGCGKHVSKCKCSGGPRELKVFAKWRDLPDTRPDYGNPDRHKVTVDAVASETGTGTPVVTKAERASSAAVAGQVPCREGKHFAAEAEADKNDDGSWTCHACQEAGVQVDRA